MKWATYIDQIIKNRVWQKLDEWYPGGNGIYQQDDASCHVSRVSLNALSELSITELNCHSASPDLNSMENLWVIVKQRLRIQKCSSKHELIKLLKVWNNDDEYTQTSFKSFHA